MNQQAHYKPGSQQDREPARLRELVRSQQGAQEPVGHHGAGSQPQARKHKWALL